MEKKEIYDGKEGKGYQPEPTAFVTGITELQKEIKNFVQSEFPPKKIEENLSVGDKFRRWIYHQLLFIITITFLCGSIVGIYGAKIYYENKMGETVQLRGFVYDKNVYEVKVRP
jgi:hypothetical protein